MAFPSLFLRSKPSISDITNQLNGLAAVEGKTKAMAAVVMTLISSQSSFYEEESAIERANKCAVLHARRWLNGETDVTPCEYFGIRTAQDRVPRNPLLMILAGWGVVAFGIVSAVVYLIRIAP